MDVSFWRRQRPWWQRLGDHVPLDGPRAGWREVELPSLGSALRPLGEATGLVPRRRSPWARLFELPRVEMPRVRLPAAELPFRRANNRFDLPAMPSAWPAEPRFDAGRWWPYLAAAVVGGLVVYLLDPRSGRRRRALARDQLVAQYRRTARRVSRTGRGVGAWGYGVTQRVSHPRLFVGDPPDDVALVDRVRAELYRHDVPKERLSMNAVDGVVELRGELADPHEVRRIELLTRAVPGVRDVHNFLHLPGTVAPNKAGALSAD